MASEVILREMVKLGRLARSGASNSLWLLHLNLPFRVICIALSVLTLLWVWVCNFAYGYDEVMGKATEISFGFCKVHS